MQTQFANLKSSWVFKILKPSTKNKQLVLESTLQRTKTKERARQFQNLICDTQRI